MATSEFKPEAKIDSKKEKSTTLREASEPRPSEEREMMKDAFGQVSELANDFYGRANNWLSTGNNKNYGFIGLVAAVGIAGFFIGRGLGSKSSMTSSSDAA